MIFDRNLNAEIIFDFLLSENESFQPPLTEQLNNFYKGDMSLRKFSEKLSEKATIALEKRGEDIGGVVIGYTHDTPDNKSYITYVVVNSSYRRQGIASRLLDEYFSYAKQMKMTHVWLRTSKENMNARKLYTKKKMLLVGEEENDVIIYEKCL